MANNIKLPFSLVRNEGQAVTAVSEVDTPNISAIDVTAGAPAATDTQTAILGDYPTTTPAVDEVDDSLIPLNGKNYSLGTISELGISLSIPAMTLGCTLRFTANDHFFITLPRPYTYEDENEQEVTDYPLHQARICGAVALECENGNEYLLHISTIGSGSSQDPFINVFSLTELIEPSAESDGVEA